MGVENLDRRSRFRSGCSVRRLPSPTRNNRRRRRNLRRCLGTLPLEVHLDPVAVPVPMPLWHHVLEEHAEPGEARPRLLHARRVHAEDLLDPRGDAVPDGPHLAAAEVAAAKDVREDGGRFSTRGAAREEPRDASRDGHAATVVLDLAEEVPEPREVVDLELLGRRGELEGLAIPLDEPHVAQALQGGPNAAHPSTPTRLGRQAPRTRSAAHDLPQRIVGARASRRKRRRPARRGAWGACVGQTLAVESQRRPIIIPNHFARERMLQPCPPSSAVAKHA